MRKNKLAVIGILAAGLAACDAPTATGPIEPLFEISDALHNEGNEHLFFLRPIGRPNQSDFNGSFDASAEPTIEICEWASGACAGDSLIAAFALGDGTIFENIKVFPYFEWYSVWWRTRDLGLDVDAIYRIRVLVDGIEIGFADVDVVGSLFEWILYDERDEYVPLPEDGVLPIRFRIEEGAISIPVLLAYWPFEETGGTVTADATGRGNDGELDGNVSLGISGVVGNAARFGSGDGKIVVPNSSDVVFDTQDFTVIHWFRSTQKGDAVFFSTRNTTSCSQASGPVVQGALDAGRARGTVRGTDNIQHALFSEPGPNDGAWHHFGLVRSGDVVELYLDGTLVASESLAPGLDFTTIGDFLIGMTQFCWGAPLEGAIDELRIYNGALTPTQVLQQYLDEKRDPAWGQVSAGETHSCGTLDDGRSFCWGREYGGALGTGNPGTYDSYAVEPQLVYGGYSFSSLHPSENFTCALSLDGDVYCWGRNNGEFGNGQSTDQTPHPYPEMTVPGPYSFLETGKNHTCGIRADGTTECWGYNEYGQLGDGSTEDRLSPVAVAGGIGFDAVSGAAGHTCGLTQDGIAYCWGRNDYGELGTGNQSSSTTPAMVATSLRFTQIEAGGGKYFGYTCAIATTGDAYCWGDNRDGQLGDPNYTQSSIPILVQGAHSFESLVTGPRHVCGITNDRDAYCWGSNRNDHTGGLVSEGMLGNGSTASSPIPDLVVGGHEWQSISINMGYHTCALRVDNEAFCWGGNIYGGLGTGDRDSRYEPTMVTDPPQLLP